MTAPIFVDWDANKHAAVWGHQPLRLQHRLHLHPLFSRDGLAKLVQSYPEGKYLLALMGAQGKPKSWRHGTIQGLSGEQVIEAIANGRLWLNLLHVNDVDPRYDALLDEIFADIKAHVPQHQHVRRRFCGILISSPGAQVYYHFDTTGQSLWQIIGGKRVYVYPPTPPLLTFPSLEDVTLYRDEVGIKYEDWYDNYATVQDLHPGQMMHWPLNAPHRIENYDELSVSMTVEYSTDEIWRRTMLNNANGIIRNATKREPRRSIHGPIFWAKTGLYAAVKKAGVLERERRDRQAITFRLDPDKPGHIIDLV